jgi:hypothetical protein
MKSFFKAKHKPTIAGLITEFLVKVSLGGRNKMIWNP